MRFAAIPVALYLASVAVTIVVMFANMSDGFSSIPFVFATLPWSWTTLLIADAFPRDVALAVGWMICLGGAMLNACCISFLFRGPFLFFRLMGKPASNPRIHAPKDRRRV